MGLDRVGGNKEVNARPRDTEMGEDISKRSLKGKVGGAKIMRNVRPRQSSTCA